MKRFNKFGYVYSLLKKRHPNWSKAKLKSCTVYATTKKSNKLNETMNIIVNTGVANGHLAYALQIMLNNLDE